MGLFDRFSKRPSDQYITMLDSAIAQIRAGLRARFSLVFERSYPKRDAELMAETILGFAMMERPLTQEAAQFATDNRLHVTSEARRVLLEPELAKAMAYLYAARCMRITFDTKNPVAMRIVDLGNQASFLTIAIPSTVEICGTEDAVQCIIALSKFSGAFAQKARELARR
jgi:hypothetical protein